MDYCFQMLLSLVLMILQAIFFGFVKKHWVESQGNYYLSSTFYLRMGFGGRMFVEGGGRVVGILVCHPNVEYSEEWQKSLPGRLNFEGK